MSSSLNNLSSFIFFPIFSSKLIIDSVDEEMAKWWFSNISRQKLTDKNVIRFISIHKLETGEFPSKQKIEDEMCCVRCLCELGYVEQSIVEMKKHFLFNEGRLPTCRETENTIEYQLLNKKLPTYSELREYVNNKIEFNSDPVQYFNNDKVDRPADTSKVKVISPTETVKENCCICFDEIGMNTYYKLPCGHYFHSNKDNCLGEASIEEWFKKNNFCPNCKQKL